MEHHERVSLFPDRLSLILSAVVLAVFSALPLIVKSDYYLHMFILGFMYSVLGLAWNFIGGEAGQVSFGQAIFFGVGAYVSSAVSVKLGLSPWLGMVVGGVAAATLAILIGMPTFKIKGFYFTIATLAMGEIAVVLMRRVEYLGGARGFMIPMLEEGWANFQFHDSKIPYYFISLGLLVITVCTAWIVKRSKLGFYFRAIRGDDVAAMSLGIHVSRYKIAAYALSAVFAAFAGSFYAQYTLYIDPDSLMANTLSTQFAFMCILGGICTIPGPIIGAITLIFVQQITMATFGGAKAVHLLIYGALIIFIALYEPRGIVQIVKSQYSKRRRKRNV